jgi:hypothetical protein
MKKLKIDLDIREFSMIVRALDEMIAQLDEGSPEFKLYLDLVNHLDRQALVQTGFKSIPMIKVVE